MKTRHTHRNNLLFCNGYDVVVQWHVKQEIWAVAAAAGFLAVYFGWNASETV